MGFPLPAKIHSDCCWQALQQVSITYKQEQHKLTIALAHQQEAFTVVAMGPLGNRLLSIRQSKQGLEVQQAAYLPKQLPAEFILALVHTWWLPEGQQLSDPRWSVAYSGDSRIIRYKREGLIVLDAPKRPLPSKDEIIHMQHLKLPLTIVARTMSVLPL